jgi:predicted tellurium resistance membrane protein TerC
MLALLTDPEVWVSFAFLTVMEIVLGIDNIVFLTILSGRLPREQQMTARRLGLAGALVTRVMLLLALSWLAHLQKELFFFVRPWSGRDLVLMAGGLFLLWKATKEIYENVEHPDSHEDAAKGGSGAGLFGVVVQIAILDIVFSIDSVITAVGTAEHLEVMVGAVLAAVAVMMLFARPVGDFVQDHPSVRILALAFLVLIGVTLLMEGSGQHVEKGYTYAAMAFSFLVQVLNVRRDQKLRKVADLSG